MTAARLTDKTAIRLALETAIEREQDFIECYRDRHTGKLPSAKTDPESASAIDHADRLIKAWRRCLKRYYGSGTTRRERQDAEFDRLATINIMDLLKGTEEDRK